MGAAQSHDALTKLLGTGMQLGESPPGPHTGPPTTSAIPGPGGAAFSSSTCRPRPRGRLPRGPCLGPWHPRPWEMAPACPQRPPGFGAQTPLEKGFALHLCLHLGLFPPRTGGLGMSKRGRVWGSRRPPHTRGCVQNYPPLCEQEVQVPCHPGTRPPGARMGVRSGSSDLLPGPSSDPGAPVVPTAT